MSILRCKSEQSIPGYCGAGIMAKMAIIEGCHLIKASSQLGRDANSDYF